MVALASVQDLATKINGRTNFTLDARRFRANIYGTCRHSLDALSVVHLA